jgi:mannosyltransferase OCH1-like enzyme
MIWIGDETKRPDAFIATWRDKHPSWEFRLWGNDDLDKYTWHLSAHMKRLAEQGLWHGVADLLRYQILINEGGVYADADSECLESLDELLDYEAFAAFEHENAAPGLIGNSVIGAAPLNTALRGLVAEIGERHNVSLVNSRVLPIWRAIGPEALTRAFINEGYATCDFLLLPSCAFYPIHHTGRPSPVKGKTYCKQHWFTTRNLYDHSY